MPEKKRAVVLPFKVMMPLFIISVLASCTKAELDYGSQLVGDQYTQLVMTDTFTTNISTVYIDSFITSASGTATLGSYYDNEFGQITASSYFQLSPPSFTDKNVVFDSLELVLTLNRKWYGDSTQPLQLNVYELTQAISKTNSTSWYNYDTLTHAPDAIGSKTLLVYPNVTDTISIRLSDVLGKQLLSLLQNNSDEVSSTDNFLNYFKGICIIPSEAKAGIMGCKDSVQMRLHYKETSAITAVNKTANFILNNTARQFNHISVSRTGTPLQNLGAENKALASTLTGNAAFMQPTTNALVKIRIPNIRNILQIPNYLRMERAILTIKPVLGTYTGYYTLPDSLRLTSTDKNNAIGSDITYSDGAVQYGPLNRDALYEENTGYSYDITNYLTSQLSVTEINNENGVLLRPPAADLTTGFARVVIGDEQNKSSAIKLQIYYLTVQ